MLENYIFSCENVSDFPIEIHNDFWNDMAGVI